MNEHFPNYHLRLLTHVGFFSRTGSDAFGIVLIDGKEQESRKKYLQKSS